MIQLIDTKTAEELNQAYRRAVDLVRQRVEPMIHLMHRAALAMPSHPQLLGVLPYARRCARCNPHWAAHPGPLPIDGHEYARRRRRRRR